MIEPKVSLTMLVPGATMFSLQECSTNSKECYDTHKIMLEWVEEEGKKKKLKRDLITFKTRKSRLVSRHINISKEAYDYMLNTSTIPKMQKKWTKLAIKERLKHHFDQIASDFNAVSYSFEILDD